MQKYIIPCFAILSVVLFFGCGGTTATWPSNPENDWVKEVQKRGMGNVWGDEFKVEGMEGETSINPGGTFGETPEETEAWNDIFFGKTAIKLETTGKKNFKLSINGKKYGIVEKGDEVIVDEDKKVWVNERSREPK